MEPVVDSLVVVEPFKSASDLRKMPQDRRDAIMAKAAALAEGLYRSSPILTDFEAFEAEETDGDATKTR